MRWPTHFHVDDERTPIAHSHTHTHTFAAHNCRAKRRMWYCMIIKVKFSVHYLFFLLGSFCVSVWLYSYCEHGSNWQVLSTCQPLFTAISWVIILKHLHTLQHVQEKASVSLSSTTQLWSREVISCIYFRRKHRSCSSLFWNCVWASLRITVMTLLSVFSEKSVWGKPCLSALNGASSCVSWKMFFHM